jgi:hypothetical protein
MTEVLEAVFQLGYKQDDRGIGFRFSERAKDFSLLDNIQTITGVRKASYATGNRGQCPRGYGGSDVKLINFV